MVDGSIADDVVEDDMHTPFVSLLEEPSGILVGTIAWRYLLVVADIIAGIFEGRVKEGIEPDGIHTQTFHIVEFTDDTL